MPTHPCSCLLACCFLGACCMGPHAAAWRPVVGVERSPHLYAHHAQTLSCSSWHTFTYWTRTICRRLPRSNLQFANDTSASAAAASAAAPAAAPPACATAAAGLKPCQHPQAAQVAGRPCRRHGDAAAGHVTGELQSGEPSAADGGGLRRRKGHGSQQFAARGAAAAACQQRQRASGRPDAARGLTCSAASVTAGQPGRRRERRRARWRRLVPATRSQHTICRCCKGGGCRRCCSCCCCGAASGAPLLPSSPLFSPDCGNPPSSACLGSRCSSAASLRPAQPASSSCSRLLLFASSRGASWASVRNGRRAMRSRVRPVRPAGQEGCGERTVALTAAPSAPRQGADSRAPAEAGQQGALACEGAVLVPGQGGASNRQVTQRAERRQRRQVSIPHAAAPHQRQPLQTRAPADQARQQAAAQVAAIEHGPPQAPACRLQQRQQRLRGGAAGIAAVGSGRAAVRARAAPAQRLHMASV